MRWLAAAIALGERGRGRSWPNPNVGCVIVNADRVVGRGWTQPGGRPHAEAMALAQAGGAARGASAYVSLEPCAHESTRGPACADLLAQAGIARVTFALGDPDPRTRGQGALRLQEAGVQVTADAAPAAAARSMAGWLTRRDHGRPHVTLKLALSLDGALALGDGRSRWITGVEARGHAHLERSRADLILVGRGTLDADRPALDVRLAGLEDRSPRRVVLGGDAALPGWTRIRSFEEIADLPGDWLLAEGGAVTAAFLLKADLVDRLLIYRAPIIFGGGRTLPDIGLADLADAHGRWLLVDARALGSDRLEVYERVRS